MTGPEHYREAENLLGFVAEESGHTMANVRNALAGAQVHATLALAAATALNDNESVLPVVLRKELKAWRQVAGTPNVEAGP